MSDNIEATAVILTEIILSEAIGGKWDGKQIVTIRYLTQCEEKAIAILYDQLEWTIDNLQAAIEDKERNDNAE